MPIEDVYKKENLHGIPIFRTQITFNITNYLWKFGKVRPKPAYIVIHDTANPSASDYDHWKYFKSQNRNSSADFFVDWNSITRINDYTKNYTWHCGDNDHNFHLEHVQNHNSIGIEMCLNDISNPQKKESLINNTIVLVRELQRWQGIPNHKVLRHYDVTHKWCPGNIPYVILGPQIAPLWLDFKSKLL